MGCGSVTALVAAQGAVVLGTGGHSYDRFVANGSYCERGQGSEPAFERTTDKAQCLIGYRCTRSFAGGRGE